MARKKIPLIHNQPFHIWARSNNKEWFSVDPDTCWNIFCDFLVYVSRSYDFKIHAFVMMNNHYHLLASTSTYDRPFIMNRFHTEVSKALNEISGRENHIFGQRYKCSRITSLNHYERILKYIYQNPVKAGLSKKAELYKYSTASGLYGFSRLLINVDRTFETDFGISDDLEKFTQLINEPIDEELTELIRKGLMKAEFKLPVKRSSRRSF